MMDRDAVLALTPRARRAVVELYQTYRKKLEQYRIARQVMFFPPGYTAQLSREYEDQLKSIIREGMTEVENDRNVRVKCPLCGKEQTIAGDVPRWDCTCSPVERWAFQTCMG